MVLRTVPRDVLHNEAANETRDNLAPLIHNIGDINCML